MMDKLLHTPEGVRDIYNSECETKMSLERNLKSRIHRYGFRDIQTPTFEFFDIFSKERGTVPSKDMYKFFDREGNTLALRPDITPSIARCVAKYYKEESMPIRLCYCGSTFINNSSYQGKLKETTQLGAELINDASVEADAEMIVLTVECLKLSGLEEFQVEIGQADFFKGLVEEATLKDDEVEQLRVLIENKNLFGVEELISEKQIEEPVKKVFLQLTELFGSIEIVSSIKSIIKNQRAIKAIERLEQLYDLLKAYGVEKYISFDLGMLSKYNYYTGIIFRAYTNGTGDAVITGGRYDTLVSQFGKDAPAIGMAVLVDQLLTALSRQKLIPKLEPTNTLIVYKKELRNTAIALTQHFRSEDMNIELLLEEKEIEINTYIEYANRSSIGGILYLAKPNEVLVINAGDGSTTMANLSDFLE
ncbi:ATP phosphoribosyltransferase regulatory subunit [Clostridium sp. Marseille-P299]|uniref:ATP phosphoribosyltransferase regulatory subunit n=1 Tax=Clostridium sp. Marseille-P299 TaxID=1805477 RepID=UPI00082B1690